MTILLPQTIAVWNPPEVLFTCPHTTSSKRWLFGPLLPSSIIPKVLILDLFVILILRWARFGGSYWRWGWDSGKRGSWCWCCGEGWRALSWQLDFHYVRQNPLRTRSLGFKILSVQLAAMTFRISSVLSRYVSKLLYSCQLNFENWNFLFIFFFLAVCGTESVVRIWLFEI